MTRVRKALLLAAVAVAFADSSIVVLGVPSIVRELDVAVGGASWVITAYNLAVVAAAALLLPVVGRLRVRLLAGAGFAAFALASVGCAVSPSFALLVGFRALQGAAAALVLVTAFLLLGGAAGARAWTAAATVGFAGGPALGGLLTEVFSWRAIFVAQAPLVALGLVALRRVVAETEAPGARRSWLPDAVAAAVSAALVGALFLVVVLLIEGFGWQPLPAALVATTLPALAIAAERWSRHLPARPSVVGGSLLVAGGLAALAFVPGASTGAIVAGLALCGAGFGLVAQPLGRLGLAGGEPGQVAARAVLARHAGLVVALVVLTPVLVSSLGGLERNAEAVGGEVVLRAELPLTKKVPLLTKLARTADAGPTSVPDFEDVLGGDPATAAVGRRLTATLHDLVARAFRPAFLGCAGFALLAALLGTGLEGGARRRALAADAAAVLLAAGVAVLALGVERSQGSFESASRVTDPCRPGAGYPGGGVDGTVQRVALRALAGAACDLHTTRPELVRRLAEGGRLPWPSRKVDEAVHTGLRAAVDQEREDGRIGRVTAYLLRLAADHAPVSWLRRTISAAT